MNIDDICHELNVNTINSNFDYSSPSREHQECDQVVEELSNLLNLKRVLHETEQLPIEKLDSNASTDLVDLDDDFLAYKRFFKKKLKKKKEKSLDNRMDLALIEVLAGEDPLAAAKKFQINTNDLLSYVNRYKNIQQMTNKIATTNQSNSSVYKIKRAQENDIISNQDEMFEIHKPWDFQNSNRPSSSLEPVLVSNAENPLRLPKTFSIQIFNK